MVAAKADDQKIITTMALASHTGESRVEGRGLRVEGSSHRTLVSLGLRVEGRGFVI